MLTARESGIDNGCIVNTCVQVSVKPDRLLISVEKRNLTREMIERTGEFNISTLTEDVPFETIRHFGMQSGRDVNKLGSFPGVRKSHNGLAYLTQNTNAMFSCRVIEKMDLGSHMMFVGEVTESKVLSDKASCTYAHYHKAIKPQPKPKSEVKRSPDQMRYVCNVCGYVYDEAEEGKKWEELPEDYECPLCSVGKDHFSPEE